VFDLGAVLAVTFVILALATLGLGALLLALLTQD
jgi:hypothetical protein